MKKIFFTVATFVMSSIFMAACGYQATDNAANKPTNAANTAATNTATAPADASADIKKLMGDLAAALAKNDADSAAKFYSDDYHLITPSGVDQTKAERLADMKSGRSKFESFEYTDINVRTYGDTAVAISTVKIKGTVSGQPSPPEVRATLVFNKTKDGWKVVSGQATPITAKPDTTKPASNTSTSANANAAKPAANK